MTNIDISDIQNISNIHEINVDIKNRELFLHSYMTCEGDEPGVDYRSAVNLQKNLRLLDNINHNPILIHMNIPGGYWSDCLGMYDTIKSCRSRTIILAYAKVESSSSVILQSADLRILMPNCHVLLHYGSISLDAEHKAATSNLRWSERESEKMLEIFTDKCIHSAIAIEKKWKKMMIKKHIQSQLSNYSDWIMSSDEAVYYGFADGVLGSDSYPTIHSLKKPNRRRKNVNDN
jgi:ATP-dependent protease ClpP protease subunit